MVYTMTAAPPLLPLLHALKWLTVLLQGYVRPHRQYGEGAPVTQSSPKVFNKYKCFYIIPATSPYYNNLQALFNLYKPVHTPQPTYTPQHTSSASTTTPTHLCMVQNKSEHLLLVTLLATWSIAGNLTMVTPTVAGITTSNPASH